MGVHFSCRNKDRGWCALKRLSHPSSDQPKPGEGWVMPFQKFQAVTLPCGTLASFALCPCTKGKELKVRVNVGPLFCSLSPSCCVTKMMQALMSDAWCQILPPPTAPLSGFRFFS